MEDKHTHNIEVIWDELAKEFRNWRGVRPRKSWFKSGLSERMGPKRVRLLEGGSQAKVYFSLTKDLSGRELEYLHARAAVNLEQAQVAARIATVLNLTVYIGAFMIFNQLFPGMIAQKTQDVLQGGDVKLTLLSVLVVVGFLIHVMGLLSYSHGGTRQARDLKHLLELSLARRALRKNKTGDDTIVTVGSDLRESFLSDI